MKPKVQPISTWRELRALDHRGRVDARSPANLLLCLREHPVLRGALRWNELECQIEFARAVPEVAKANEPLDLASHQLLAVWLEQNEGLRTSYREMDKTAFIVAKENAGNPLQSQLDALRWDGKRRMDTWVRTYLNAAGDDAQIANYGNRLLLSAVARALNPGCGVDTLWMVQTKRPEEMHAAFEVLFGSYYHRWCDSNTFYASTGNETRGKWVINLLGGEDWKVNVGLGLKSLTRRLSDPAVPTLAKYIQTVRRHCIFLAVVENLMPEAWIKSVNGKDPHFDSLVTGAIALTHLKRDRNQLLAEAVALYRSGRSHLRNAWCLSLVPETPIEVKVKEYCRERQQVTMREIVEDCLKNRYSQDQKSDYTKYGYMLKRLGLRKVQVGTIGKKMTTAYRWPR